MSQVQGAEVTAKAGRREWIGLAVIALPCMLYSMDLTVLNLAVPALSRELQPSASQLLWIIDIYGFMVAGLLVTMGNLGDRIGRRKLLMFGAAAFGLASLLAAYAKTAEQLIVLRALLGIAGATVAPSTLSLIRNLFHDPEERTAAIGIWVSAFSLGAAIGPVVGGMLLQWFHWGSVFLINVPVMLLLLAVAPSLLPEFRDPGARRMDLPSAALAIAAVLCTIYGLKRIAEHGASLEPMLAILIGLALGAVFLRRQRQIEDPMIDLALFRIPAFSAALGMYLLSCLVMFGSYIYVAQYLQLVLGLSPLAAGLWTVPWALAFVLGSTYTPQLRQRYGTLPLVAAGLGLGALGYLLLVFAGRDGLAFVVAGTTLSSLGLAPVFTLSTDLVVGCAPPARAGSAAAMSETCSEFGGALGIALFGSLGTALYRTAMQNVPSTTEAARSTLGAASELASTLPGGGEALLHAARGAFLQGFTLTVTAATIAMLLLTAVAAWAAKRGVPGVPTQT